MKSYYMAFVGFFCFSMHAMDLADDDEPQKAGPSEYNGRAMGALFASHLHTRNFAEALRLLASLSPNSGVTIAFLQSAIGQAGDTPLHCVTFLLGQSVYEQDLPGDKLNELETRLLQLGAHNDVRNRFNATPRANYLYGVACAAASRGIRLDFQMLRRGQIVALPQRSPDEIP